MKLVVTKHSDVVFKGMSARAANVPVKLFWFIDSDLVDFTHYEPAS